VAVRRRGLAEKGGDRVDEGAEKAAARAVDGEGRGAVGHQPDHASALGCGKRREPKMILPVLVGHEIGFIGIFAVFGTGEHGVPGRALLNGEAVADMEEAAPSGRALPSAWTSGRFRSACRVLDSCSARARAMKSEPVRPSRTEPAPSHTVATSTSSVTTQWLASRPAAPCS